MESWYGAEGPVAAVVNPETAPSEHERVRREMGMRPGGFGILVASKPVDEMIYNERHNEVVLIKYLHAVGASPATEKYTAGSSQS